MKLYATITSERAAKGQGGNDFIQINLFDDKKICFGSLCITPNLTVGGSVHGQLIQIEKGNKQKGDN